MSKRGGGGRNQGRKRDFEDAIGDKFSRIKVPALIRDIVKEFAKEIHRLGVPPKSLKFSLKFFEDTAIPASFGKTDVGSDNYTILNLNQFVTERNTNQVNETFLVKVTGDSMIEAGIFPSDLLVVEMCNEPINQDIVIARVGDTLTVKRYEMVKEEIKLSPESSNPEHQPITIPKTEQDPFEIVGIVRHVIHDPKNRY